MNKPGLTLKPSPSGSGVNMSAPEWELLPYITHGNTLITFVSDWTHSRPRHRYPSLWTTMGLSSTNQALSNVMRPHG